MDSRQLDFADYLNEPNKIFEVLQRNLLGKTSDENRTYTLGCQSYRIYSGNYWLKIPKLKLLNTIR